eukprot:766407-Hanusia_phi.AAC.1
MLLVAANHRRRRWRAGPSYPISASCWLALLMPLCMLTHSDTFGDSMSSSEGRRSFLPRDGAWHSDDSNREWEERSGAMEPRPSLRSPRGEDDMRLDPRWSLAPALSVTHSHFAMQSRFGDEFDFERQGICRFLPPPSA